MTKKLEIINETKKNINVTCVDNKNNFCVSFCPNNNSVQIKGCYNGKELNFYQKELFSCASSNEKHFLELCISQNQSFWKYIFDFEGYNKEAFDWLSELNRSFSNELEKIKDNNTPNMFQFYEVVERERNTLRYIYIQHSSLIGFDEVMINDVLPKLKEYMEKNYN